MPISLMEEIENLKAKSFKNFPKDTVEELLKITDELVAEGVDQKAVKQGDTINHFELIDEHGYMVNTETLLKEGPLVISFYRGGWCSFCNLELRALQDIYPRLKDLGANLMAISPQLTEYSVETKEKQHLAFYVLSDFDNQVARSFGLIFELIKNLANLYRVAFDLDLKKINGNDHYEFPIPATYVVRQDGTVHYAFIDADYTKRMEPEEVVRQVREVKSQGAGAS